MKVISAKQKQCEFDTSMEGKIYAWEAHTGYRAENKEGNQGEGIAMCRKQKGGGTPFV